MLNQYLSSCLDDARRDTKLDERFIHRQRIRQIRRSPKGTGTHKRDSSIQLAGDGAYSYRSAVVTGTLVARRAGT